MNDLEVNLMVKECLKSRGITQAFLSRRTGIEQTKLNMALNGNRRLSLGEYATICGVLGVNTDYFLKPRLPGDEEIKRGA